MSPYRPASADARSERSIGRSVVDDDDLERRSTEREQAPQRRRDHRLFVVDRHDDRHRRLGRIARSRTAAVLDVMQIAEPEQQDVPDDEHGEKREHERDADLSRYAVRVREDAHRNTRIPSVAPNWR